MGLFGRKKAKQANDMWAGWPESLDVGDINDVNWIKQSNDPLVWHAAAMACLIFRGDKHDLIPWLVQQPSLDRVTAAAMFLHRSNGIRRLTNDQVELVQMKQGQVEEMIDLLCKLDTTQIVPDNGIGLASGWELERQEAVTLLANNPRIPRAILDRPIDRQTAAMPYTDIGEGELVSDAFMRKNMPFMFE